MAGPTLRLRLWLVPNLALLLSVVGLSLWLQQQLPARLSRAARSGDWSACLRVSQQLQTLRWLGAEASSQQSLCRRHRAETLWSRGARLEALQLQRQLVRSADANSADVNQLQAWRQALQDQALIHYQQGELSAALALLASLNRGESNATLSASLEDNWHRNRLEAQRAQELMQKQRWWEAQDRLNRIDHPWWQQQTQPQRQRIDAALAALDDSREHRQHGSSHGAVIEGEALNNAVEQKLQQGLEAWSAFEAGCRSLGGAVEEDGPESFCRAISTDLP